MVHRIHRQRAPVGQNREFGVRPSTRGIPSAVWRIGEGCRVPAQLAEVERGALKFREVLARHVPASRSAAAGSAGDAAETGSVLLVRDQVASPQAKPAAAIPVRFQATVPRWLRVHAQPCALLRHAGWRDPRLGPSPGHRRDAIMRILQCAAHVVTGVGGAGNKVLRHRRRPSHLTLPNRWGLPLPIGNVGGTARQSPNPASGAGSTPSDSV